MKTIKTLLLVSMTPFLLTTLNSCTDYQDEIDALDVRVTYLESLVKEYNTNIESLRTIVDAVKTGDYITNIAENSTGYTISFANHVPITLLNGKDAQMPKITVVKDDDGNYYWKVDGQWPKDENGNIIKVKATGNDGASPKVKIGTDGFWYISADGSNNYKLYLDEQGKPVPVSGTNGVDTNPITNVTYDTQTKIVTFTIWGKDNFKVQMI